MDLQRPNGMSIGSTVTVAPSARAFATVLSRIGDREAHAPVRRDLGREVVVGHLHHAADGLPGEFPNRVGLRRALERRATRDPAKDGRVEHLVGVGVTGKQ
jgi:hypothetical protein